jgi:hypothetical protein
MSEVQVVLMLGGGVLVFGLIIVLSVIVVIARSNTGWNAEATRVVGLTDVTIAAVFMVTAGYHAEKIAPAIGLLGSIAGFLAGRVTGSQGAERVDRK